MPLPRHPGGRAERDQEDDANEWAMMFTMKDADVARLCDRMPMTLDPVLQLARSCGPPAGAAVRHATSSTPPRAAAELEATEI